MKRRDSAILITIFTVIAIASAVVVINVSKPVEIKITFPEMSAAQRNFILPLINGFKEKTAGTVEFDYIKSTEILNELKSGNKTSDLYYFINNFQLRNMQSDSLFDKLNAKKNDETPEVFFQNEQFIPISWYPWGVYYNKNLFRELNLSVPETWKDFLLLCGDVKEKGYTPLSLMTKIKWPSTPWFDYIDILINGEDFHRQLLAGEVPFTDERAKAVFSEILNLHKNGFVHMESESFEWQSMIKALEDEKTLMHLSGSFFYENTPESFKADLGWFPFPEVKTLVASSSGFVSPAGGKNRRGIKKFLDYVLSEEGQNIIQRNSDLIAVNSSVSAKLNRDDLNFAVSRLDKYDSLVPSFERNTHEIMLIPFKSAINSLYSLSDETQLDQLLARLEEYRVSSSK